MSNTKYMLLSFPYSNHTARAIDGFNIMIPSCLNRQVGIEKAPRHWRLFSCRFEYAQEPIRLNLALLFQQRLASKFVKVYTFPRAPKR